MIKALIFDMDGTLGDTLPVCFAAFQRALQAHGVHMTDTEIEAQFGPTEEGIIRKIVTPEQGDDAARIYRETYEEVHDSICSGPFDGIPECLRLLQERGVRLAIATGKGEYGAWVSIKSFGFDGMFSPVMTGSDEKFVKPELLKQILAEWTDLSADEIAYVGDVPWDADAAREAGMKAILVAWNPGADIEGLKAKKPDAFFQTQTEFQRWIEQDL